MFARDGFPSSQLYWLLFVGAVGLMLLGCWLVEANGGGGWKMLALNGWLLAPVAAAALLAQWQRKK
jgi:hypothetical protein